MKNFNVRTQYNRRICNFRDVNALQNYRLVYNFRLVTTDNNLLEECFRDTTNTKILNKNFSMGSSKIAKSQQHPGFPGGHPSKYSLGPTLLNFADRTRSGVFNVVWSLASTGGPGSQNKKTCMEKQCF